MSSPRAWCSTAAVTLVLGGYGSDTWGTPVQGHSGVNDDALAIKVNGSGALVWNTFAGGVGSDLAYDIAIDGSDNVYLTGYSTATWGSPVRAYGAGNDAFVMELTSAGARAWNTFLGGAGGDSGNAIATDGSGGVYVAGNSDATWGTPVRAYTALSDGFVAKLDTPTTTLTQRVAAASDDAEEEGPTGTTPNRMWLDSSDIELVSDFDSPSAGVQKVGLRFTGMNIPVGATITDAYIVFRAVAADPGMTKDNQHRPDHYQ